MASLHIEGEALQWFQWINCLKNYPKWEDFSRLFCREFEPSDFNDCAEKLVKLRQTGLLRNYVSESLANRTLDMNPSLMKSCFVGD